MYRSGIFLFILFCLTESHHNCHGDHDCKVNYRLSRQSIRKYEKLFDTVSRLIIHAERELQHACNTSSSHPIREVLHSDFYVLKYTLPEFVGGDILIKIKNRVIYLSASKSNGPSFRNVRILPQIINTHSGQWFMEDGDVKVMFNYKSPLNTVTTTLCEDYLDDHVLTVPMMATGTLVFRTGDITEPHNLTMKL